MYQQLHQSKDAALVTEIALDVIKNSPRKLFIQKYFFSQILMQEASHKIKLR
jgi:hypothetical protein